MAKLLIAGRMPRRFRGFVGALAVIGAVASVLGAGRAGADAMPETVAAASTKPVPLPPGHVWECMVNGQRTFSDVRCGAQSTIRQLGAVNIMDATSARASAPGFYQTEYAPRPVQPMAPDDNAADDANDAYWGPGIIAVNPRVLRGHHVPHGNHGHWRARRN